MEHLTYPFKCCCIFFSFTLSSKYSAGQQSAGDIVKAVKQDIEKPEQQKKWAEMRSHITLMDSVSTGRQQYKHDAGLPPELRQ